MKRLMKLAAEIRKQLGEKKYQMAKRLGIKQQSWEILETKSTNPHVKHLISLWHISRDELGWSADEFLSGLEKDVVSAERKRNSKK